MAEGLPKNLDPDPAPGREEAPKSEQKQEMAEVKVEEQPVQPIEKDVLGHRKAEAVVADLREKQSSQDQLEAVYNKEREAIVDGLVAQNRVINTVESFLEEQTLETSSQDSVAGKKPVKTAKRSFLGRMALGATLILGTIIGSQQEGPEGQTDGAERPRIAERAGADLNERMGFDLAETAESCNFDTELEVDNGKGPYIVDIGQIHNAAAGGILAENITDKNRDEIILTQQDIEKFILATHEKAGIKEVFSEGVTKDSIGYFTKAKEEKEWLDKQKPTIDTYCKTVKKLFNYENNDSYKKDFERRMAASTMCHYDLLKVEEMEGYFQKNPPAIERNGRKDPFDVTDGEKFSDAKKKLKK
jgi:hypothetical protein